MSSQITWAKEGTQVFLLGIGLVVLLKLARKIADYYSSSLRHLKGPSNVSFATGNVLQLTAPHTHVVREWREQYGTTFRIWGPLMVRFCGYVLGMASHTKICGVGPAIGRFGLCRAQPYLDTHYGLLQA